MNQPKLKPLNHKQMLAKFTVPLSKTGIEMTNKSVLGKTINEKQPSLQQKESLGSVGKRKSNVSSENIKNTNYDAVPSREIKTPMKMQRTSNKKIESYDCEDDFDVDLEENMSNQYFQGQIEKGIKQETLVSVKKQPQNKALIVLPKLESEVKTKGTKDLEKQMDLQMSRMMEKDQDDGYY